MKLKGKSASRNAKSLSLVKLAVVGVLTAREPPKNGSNFWSVPGTVLNFLVITCNEKALALNDST